MAFQFIELSGLPQRLWLTRRRQWLKQLLTVWSISLLLSAWVGWQAVGLAQQNAIQRQHISELALRYQRLQQQVARFHHDGNPAPDLGLNEAILSPLLAHLSQMPLPRGGLENARIYRDGSVRLKLIGTLREQSAFEPLLAYWQRDYPVKIEHFQLTEDQQLRFSLLIDGEKH